MATILDLRNKRRVFKQGREAKEVWRDGVRLWERPVPGDPVEPEEHALVELFTGGRKGLLIDLNDDVASPVWANTAGTTPATSDTDVAARVDDLSPNGWHLMQPTASQRPIHRVIDGVRRLRHDGVDDTLGRTISETATDFLIVMRLSVATQGFHPLISLGDISNNATLWSRPSGTSWWWAMLVKGGVEHGFGSGTWPNPLSRQTVTFQKSGTALSVRVNGSQIGSRTSAHTGVPFNSIHTARTADLGYGPVDLERVFLRLGSFTTAERNQVEAYFS
jgi:hypothetical protein